jgi:hypothetical protein
MTPPLPDVVLVELGVNDADAGVFAENAQRILAAALDDLSDGDANVLAVLARVGLRRAAPATVEQVPAADSARPVAATVARPALSRSLPPIRSRLSRKSHKAPVPLGVNCGCASAPGQREKRQVVARGAEGRWSSSQVVQRAPETRRCARNSQIRPLASRIKRTPRAN